MDLIREAFERIKQDIFSLQQQIIELKHEITILKQEKTPQNTQTNQTNIQTMTPVESDNQTHIQTMNYLLEPLRQPNMPFSTGNRGVQTDNQTDRQTIRQTDNPTKTPYNQPNFDNINDFYQAKKILDSLDNVKKQIRLKFKRLTTQEMLVFSTLYALEEQNIEEITYKLISNNIGLSQSSIRDYIQNIIKKGIPVHKIRQNNKKITLKISSDLKNLASLSTITQLRDL